jgi:predicted metal-dependent hydrolase
MAGTSYDPLYIQGIQHFNNREFFDAHEAWEELWTDNKSSSRLFYQGLIQTAVCLHHFGRGNTRGARKLYHSSRRYLDPYRPVHLGLDIECLYRQMDRCCAEIVSSDADNPVGKMDPERIPEITLQT